MHFKYRKESKEYCPKISPMFGHSLPALWATSAQHRAQFKQKQRKVKMREMNCKWLRMSNIS